MGYLIFQILVFLLIAAMLGFVIGWLLRGARFQNELKDLDARWRSKLSEVETERDRFVGEVTQANEARAKFEASAAEAKSLTETHEQSLQKLHREHQSKLSALSAAEKRVGDLESDLAARAKELTEAKASLADRQAAGGDAQKLGRDLAAATARTETLERDLQTAKEANGTCKREVERLQAHIMELERTASGSSTSGGGALGLVGGTDSVRSADRTGSGAAGGGSGAGSSGGPGNENEPGFRQRAASPSHLAEADGQGFSGATGSASSGGDQENEGLRPEALAQARGGVADDLKKISGVGPKLEKTLNGLGIYHFAQIAAFTPDNVAWVDRHLRFKGRIEREKWIDQAKTLAAGSDTEFSRRN
ncbi:MAG: hypothetical protein ACR2RF_20995 [Geminicoccaceae bacterium]